MFNFQLFMDEHFEIYLNRVGSHYYLEPQPSWSVTLLCNSIL